MMHVAHRLLVTWRASYPSHMRLYESNTTVSNDRCMCSLIQNASQSRTPSTLGLISYGMMLDRFIKAGRLRANMCVYMSTLMTDSRLCVRFLRPENELHSAWLNDPFLARLLVGGPDPGFILCVTTPTVFISSWDTSRMFVQNAQRWKRETVIRVMDCHTRGLVPCEPSSAGRGRTFRWLVLLGSHVLSDTWACDPGCLGIAYWIRVLSSVFERISVMTDDRYCMVVSGRVSSVFSQTDAQQHSWIATGVQLATLIGICRLSDLLVTPTMSSGFWDRSMYTL